MIDAAIIAGPIYKTICAGLSVLGMVLGVFADPVGGDEVACREDLHVNDWELAVIHIMGVNLACDLLVSDVMDLR